MGDIALRGNKLTRVGFKQGGAYGPLRGTTAGGVAKAFRGKEGFKESQALQNKIFKKFKKTINKTPNKIIPKTQKKKKIKQQKSKKDKFEQKGHKWMSPIKLRKGGKV